MNEVINKELCILDKKIYRYECKLKEELDQFKQDVNEGDLYNIIEFAETKIKRLRNYYTELDKLKEQKGLLKYVLEESK